ncbi:hypothetical protein BDV06DRAFT_202376 [Aspergillus oleicola]
MEDGSAVQGEEIDVSRDKPVNLRFINSWQNGGFFSLEAFSASGLIWSRNLWSEADLTANKILRVTWGRSAVPSSRSQSSCSCSSEGSKRRRGGDRVAVAF